MRADKTDKKLTGLFCPVSFVWRRGTNKSLPYSLSERPAECGRIFYHIFVVPFLIRPFARFAKRIAGACRIKWTSYHSGRFDSTRFKEDHAEPAAAYMKVSTTRRFPLIKNPEQLSRHSGEYPVQNQ
ncbi:MAG: hypothetical protein E7335_10345 [Clostridiales bacterium]|nr:hypothetical protein [Clostridiales bacterium]